jgi:glucose-6-phosphate 1-dehydrogenase
VKVLKAIEPVALGPDGDVARAQYAAGMIGGKPVPGYLEEKGIAPKSATETYAAIRLSINNWRWQGVPFYLRSGKRLPGGSRRSRSSSSARRARSSPEGGFNLAANTLSFQIQPDEGLSLILNAKIPGLETRTQPVKMSFRYATTFGSNTPEAYERLVLDAMIGDGTLFIRGDEAETSWKPSTRPSWTSGNRRGERAWNPTRRVRGAPRAATSS